MSSSDATQGMAPAHASRSPPPGPPPSSPDPLDRGPYPLVLAHGFSGFRSIGPLDYFYGVKAALEKDGHRVFVSQVNAYQSSVTRGDELARYITDVVLPQSGARRVNIIGHSQGGLDARYVALKLGGDKIAAVVTVASPHRGSEVADIIVGERPGPLTDILSALLNVLGGSESDAKAAMRNLTSKGTSAFNAMVPDHPDVFYFSLAGRSDKSLGAGVCESSTTASFIAKWDRYLDPIGLELALPASIIGGDEVPRIANDGLVSVASARWGIFLGCIPTDHLGEVCQLFGAPRHGGNPFTCVDLYRDLARFLVEHGF